MQLDDMYAVSKKITAPCRRSVDVSGQRALGAFSGNIYQAFRSHHHTSFLPHTCTARATPPLSTVVAH